MQGKWSRRGGLFCVGPPLTCSEAARISFYRDWNHARQTISEEPDDSTEWKHEGQGPRLTTKP